MLYNNNKTTKEKETRDVSIIYKYNLLNFQSLPYTVPHHTLSLLCDRSDYAICIKKILMNALYICVCNKCIEHYTRELKRATNKE